MPGDELLSLVDLSLGCAGVETELILLAAFRLFLNRFLAQPRIESTLCFVIILLAHSEYKSIPVHKLYGNKPTLLWLSKMEQLQ